MAVACHELQSVSHGVLGNKQIGNSDTIETITQAGDLQANDSLPIRLHGLPLKLPVEVDQPWLPLDVQGRNELGED